MNKFFGFRSSHIKISTFCSKLYGAPSETNKIKGENNKKTENEI